MAKYKLPKIEELFEAGVHFGHQVRRWNPQMEKYIFGAKSGIHIVDLEKTLEGLEATAEFLYEVASKGGQVIFVGTKRQAADIVEIEAKRSGALFVRERWLGGTITNFRIIKKNINKLSDYLRKREDGTFDKYTKKERLLLDREIDKLQASVGGISALQGKPAAVFVIDIRREKTAAREANKYGIPVAALIDTNSSPEGVRYVIPGNDDAMRSIALIVKVLADAVEEGYKEFGKQVEAGKAVAESPVVNEAAGTGIDQEVAAVMGSTAVEAVAAKTAKKPAKTVKKPAAPKKKPSAKKKSVK